jgi:hypothetical protein
MSIRKKQFISICIILFCIICLYQPLDGYREDWPFSFFGMYKGRLGTENVFRMDADIVLPNNDVISIFDLPLNYYHMADVLEKYQDKILTMNSDTIKSELSQIFEKDILPQIDRCKKCTGAKEIIVRRRYWSNFSENNKHSPDENTVIFKYQLTDGH